MKPFSWKQNRPGWSQDWLKAGQTCEGDCEFCSSRVIRDAREHRNTPPLDTTYHDRRLAKRLEDPEFREGYECCGQGCSRCLKKNLETSSGK